MSDCPPAKFISKERYYSFPTVESMNTKRSQKRLKAILKEKEILNEK